MARCDTVGGGSSPHAALPDFLFSPRGRVESNGGLQRQGIHSIVIAYSIPAPRCQIWWPHQERTRLYWKFYNQVRACVQRCRILQFTCKYCAENGEEALQHCQIHRISFRVSWQCRLICSTEFKFYVGWRFSQHGHIDLIWIQFLKVRFGLPILRKVAGYSVAESNWNVAFFTDIGEVGLSE